VNVLDENIPSEQIELLRSRRIRCRAIGQEVGDLGIDDRNIVSVLVHLKDPTFFTRDRHFFRRELCHQSYCLVWLDIEPQEVATFVVRFLRHPRFNTKHARKGIVARLHHGGISIFQSRQTLQQEFAWLELVQ
jgi:hypothetical protein